MYNMIKIFFSLPIATPPNAIAFSYGYLETVDMIKVGTLLNILCVLVTAMLLPIIAFPAYSLGEFPAWAVMTAEGAGDVLVNATMTTLGITLSFIIIYLFIFFRCSCINIKFLAKHELGATVKKKCQNNSFSNTNSSPAE